VWGFFFQRFFYGDFFTGDFFSGDFFSAIPFGDMKTMEEAVSR